MKTLSTLGAALALSLSTQGAMAAIDTTKIYAGWLETTVDTTAGGCGGEVGEHNTIQYRPGMPPTSLDSIYLRHGGGSAILQSNDAAGVFFTDGTKGKVKGTVLFSSGGPEGLQVAPQTLLGTYTLKLDSADPVLVKITKMTVKFTMKPSGQVCEFTYNGVLTPMLMPSP